MFSRQDRRNKIEEQKNEEIEQSRMPLDSLGENEGRGNDGQKEDREEGEDQKNSDLMLLRHSS